MQKNFPSRSAYGMADRAEPVCAASLAQKCQRLKVDQNEQQTPPWPKVAFFQMKSVNIALFLRPWPLIGSLHLLGRFKRVPFEAFTALQKVNSHRIQDSL